MGENGGEQGLTDSSRWVGLRDAVRNQPRHPCPSTPGHLSPLPGLSSFS